MVIGVTNKLHRKHIRPFRKKYLEKGLRTKRANKHTVPRKNGDRRKPRSVLSSVYRKEISSLYKIKSASLPTIVDRHIIRRAKQLFWSLNNFTFLGIRIPGVARALCSIEQRLSQWFAIVNLDCPNILPKPVPRLWSVKCLSIDIHKGKL